MIYLKNTKEKQTIYIPRTELYTEQYVNPAKTYEEGYSDGFGKGVDKGIEEQKSKLETIVINDNGTYEREDGYNKVIVEYQDLNGSYNDGYADGKNDGYNEGKEDGFSDGYNEGYDVGYTDGGDNQKSKLETITITENGTYTKEDGYNSIEVNVPDLNGSYDEGFEQGQIEGYNKGKNDGIDEQKSKLESISITENGVYAKEDGYNKIVVEVPDLNGSYDDGYSEGYDKGKDDGYNEGVEEGVSNAGEIIAQTAQVLDVTENGIYTTKYSNVDSGVTGDYTGDNLIKTVNVNVQPKINITKEKIKFACAGITTIPEWGDFEGVTDMSRMFYECRNLITIPPIDTSKVTTMERMFYNCTKLTTIPPIDTSNVTNMYQMLCECSNLITIPPIDTSNVTDMQRMFYYCTKLTTIPPIDTSNVTNMYYMFYNCSSLESLPALNLGNISSTSNINRFFNSTITSLTDIGGFLDLKVSWNDNYGLKVLPNLTYQSCVNVLNGLYDFTSNGETPSSSQGKLKVHANFLTTVGDEISIGTNKGWTITA